MFTIEEIQSIGIFVNALIAVIVVLVPVRNTDGTKRQNGVYNTSRWMLASALALFVVHFTLQRTMGFRHMEGQQAALVNTLFYLPAFVLINLGILNLLSFGNIKPLHKRLGWGVIGIMFFMIFGSALIDEGGLMGDSALIHAAQFISSALSAVVLGIYNYEEWRCYHCISMAMNEYYDSPQQSLIKWCAASVVLFDMLIMLTLIMVYVPSTSLLFFHGCLVFSAIILLSFCFVFYGVSGDMMRMMAAEKDINSPQLIDNECEPLPDEVRGSVESWLQAGRHLRSGITADEIAHEMGITRNELKLYIHAQNYAKIGSWLAVHRVEEAKRLLKEQNNYGHDAIADMCGFSSRQYFQSCFRNIVGIPPMQWQLEMKRGEGRL